MNAEAEIGGGAMASIRRTYGVPAKRGLEILYGGERYVIVGTQRGAMRLRARQVSGGPVQTLHPTWNIAYPGREVANHG